MKKILVIAAHPDDEVLGCGGTIARLVAEGAEVQVLILASGLTSRADFPEAEAAARLEKHYDCAQRAGQFLGASQVHLLGLPDQRLDTIPLLEITHALERQLAAFQPDTVFTQHGGDLNYDHVITFRATLTATRPQAGHCVKRVYAYEVASSTEWAFQCFSPVFRPDTFFDISSTLEKKIAAMQIYESETRPFPHPRSPEALRSIARRWGSTVGVHAAEAFDLVREMR